MQSFDLGQGGAAGLRIAAWPVVALIAILALRAAVSATGLDVAPDGEITRGALMISLSVLLAAAYFRLFDLWRESFIAERATDRMLRDSAALLEKSAARLVDRGGETSLAAGRMTEAARKLRD